MTQAGGRAFHQHKRRRRVLLIAAVAAAVLLSGAAWFVLRGAAFSPSMEVTHIYQRCPTQVPASLTTPGPGPLVPQAQYNAWQLCGAEERTESFPLTADDAATLVTRLNALPSGPPQPGCADATGVPDATLVLRTSGEPAVVALDTGPCDTVRHAGVVRYGAASIHRFVLTLIDEAD